MCKNVPMRGYMMAARTGKQYYKWVIAAACFLLVFLCDGFACGYRGLFLTAVSDGLGVNRTLVSMGESFRSATNALLSMFFGLLVYKFSARKLVGAGLSLLVLSLVVYSRIESVYAYWVAGTLMGAGTTFASSAMVSYLIHQWFEKNVGSILGVIFAASGLGSAVGSQVISPILYSGDPMGFRTAYSLTAAVVAVLTVIIVPLLRENPGNKFPPKPVKSAKRQTEDAPDRTGSHSNRIIICVIGACVFLTALSIMGVNSIYVSHMLDVGIDAKTVGMASGILSVALIGSKLLTGVFYDRFGLRTVLLICQGATFAAFTMLYLLNPAASASALIFPAVFAIALPLETIVITLIVSDVFGRQLYGRYIGAFSAIASVGFALAPPLSNLIYDIFGTYRLAILVNGLIMIFVSVVLHITITLRKRRNDHA